MRSGPNTRLEEVRENQSDRKLVRCFFCKRGSRNLRISFSPCRTRLRESTCTGKLQKEVAAVSDTSKLHERLLEKGTQTSYMRRC